jgi:hypothetical protein
MVVKENLHAGLSDIAAYYKGKESNTAATAAVGGTRSSAGVGAGDGSGELTLSEEATMQAFVTLVQGRLSTAAQAELWCERSSFNAYGV